MNTVVSAECCDEYIFSTTVKELLYKVYSMGNLSETAFIGKVGHAEEDALYLINYEGVVNALFPNQTWKGSPSVRIKRFVDIEIHIKEK